MSLFRFAIYFAALIACAVAAFPQWAPADADGDESPRVTASAPPPAFFTHRKAAHFHVAPTRVASRD